jgi:hypothetical protein
MVFAAMGGSCGDSNNDSCSDSELMATMAGSGRDSHNDNETNTLATITSAEDNPL